MCDWLCIYNYSNAIGHSQKKKKNYKAIGYSDKIPMQ